MPQKFVLNTWLLAQAIHPILFHFWLLSDGSDFDLGEHLQWALLVFIFTAPGFVLCVSLINPICKLNVAKSTRFFIWLVVTVLSVPVTIFFIAVLFGGLSFFFALVNFLLPGCLSAALATGVRYRQFFQLQRLHYAG
jgi:hypothetical protein